MGAQREYTRFCECPRGVRLSQRSAPDPSRLEELKAEYCILKRQWAKECYEKGNPGDDLMTPLSFLQAQIKDAEYGIQPFERDFHECPTCNGRGNYWHCPCGTHGNLTSCRKCFGTGRAKETWLLTYKQPAERPGWPESMQLWLTNTCADDHKYMSSGAVWTGYTPEEWTPNRKGSWDVYFQPKRLWDATAPHCWLYLKNWDYKRTSVTLRHPGNEPQRESSSQWQWKGIPLPFPVNITFTSKADIQRELALRKVFRSNCPGLRRCSENLNLPTDMTGWFADSNLARLSDAELVDLLNAPVPRHITKSLTSGLLKQ